jgi:hypothetical protein
VISCFSSSSSSVEISSMWHDIFRPHCNHLFLAHTHTHRPHTHCCVSCVSLYKSPENRINEVEK